MIVLNFILYSSLHRILCVYNPIIPMNPFPNFLVLLTLTFQLSNSSNLIPKEACPTKSGYLPIDQASSLYYAFYEARDPVTSISKTPLLIWLQGGPGCSSMLGNLFELGPYHVAHHNITLHKNPYSWNHRFGLLFIDNPIGTGFSIAATNHSIPRDQATVAQHLIIGLRKFISSNPSFATRPVYLTGESYAGKYVPAAGYYILQRNSEVCNEERINLHGVAIGNGLTHPVTQVATHADSAYYMGLINAKQKSVMEKIQKKAVRLTNEGKWLQASDARSEVLNYLQNLTGLATLYDFRKKVPYQSGMIEVLLNTVEAKEAFRAKKELVWGECSDVVGEVLREDVMKSVKFMVEELVKKSRVLLYQGMFDLRDGVVSTEAWIKEMEWDGLEKFLEAKRKVWKVDGDTAGYVQSSGTLSHVVVSGAGHLVPTDQGRSSQAMIEDWVMENGAFSHVSDDEKISGRGSTFSSA